MGEHHMDRTAAADASLDRYARMAQRALQVPMALVALVSDDAHILAGAAGLPPSFESGRLLPADTSFLRQVVEHAAELVSTDVRVDARLLDSVAIRELAVAGLAGWPVTDDDGLVIGSLCALDREPREWSSTELDTLSDLAAACSAELAQRRLRVLADQRAVSASRASRHSRVLLSLSEALSGTRTTADVSLAVERVAIDELGCSQVSLWLRHLNDPTHAPPPDRAHPRSPELIDYVPGDPRHWAERPTRLPVDQSNPLGASLVSGRARFFADLAAQNAGYPDLESPDQLEGERVLMPLWVGGNVYGVVVFVWPRVGHTHADDQETIRALTSYTAQAVQRAALLEEREAAASTLQSALLRRLPVVDHFEMVGRYRPAGSREKVGGDWFDVFQDATGRLHVVLGDVVGHDLDAAATMGRLQTLLAAMAWANPASSPSTVVQLLEQACLDFGDEALSTLVYGQVDAAHPELAEVTLRWTNAGHLPPLLVHPDHQVDVLTAEPADPMAGIGERRPRHDHTTVVRRGDTLLLYSDGLVERRDQGFDQGVGRLRDLAGEHAGLKLAPLVDLLLDSLVPQHPSDDVVLLAIRIPRDPRPTEGARA